MLKADRFINQRGRRILSGTEVAQGKQRVTNPDQRPAKSPRIAIPAAQGGRLLRMVWVRKKLLAAGMLACAFLGGVYYFSTPLIGEGEAPAEAVAIAMSDVPALPKIQLSGQNLTEEKTDLERQLRVKETELAALTCPPASLFAVADPQLLSERVQSLNRAFWEAEKLRLEAETGLAFLERAVRDGEDLGQPVRETHAGLKQESPGEETGPNQRELYLLNSAHQRLIESQAALDQLLVQYGPAHARVLEMKSRIRLTQAWLQNRQELPADAVRQAGSQNNAPQWIQAARQKVRKAEARENSLLAQSESEQTALWELNEQSLQREILAHDLKRMRTKHELLLKRIYSLNQAQKQRNTLVSASRVGRETQPSRPGLIFAVSQLIGVIAGLGLICAVEFREDRLQTPQDSEAATRSPRFGQPRRVEADRKNRD